MELVKLYRDSYKWTKVRSEPQYSEIKLYIRDKEFLGLFSKELKVYKAINQEFKATILQIKIRKHLKDNKIITLTNIFYKKNRLREYTKAFIEYI